MYSPYWLPLVKRLPQHSQRLVFDEAKPEAER